METSSIKHEHADTLNHEGYKTQQPVGHVGSREESGWKSISLNCDYLQTASGILKLIQLAIGLLCMSCYTPTYNPPGTHFFMLVVLISFINTLLWSTFHLMNAREALNGCINNCAARITLLELFNTIVLTTMYFIGICAQMSTWSDAALMVIIPSRVRGYFLTAGIFGIWNTILYGVLCYVLHIEWKHFDRRVNSYQLFR